MTPDQLRAMINAAFDSVDEWYAEEMDLITRPDGYALTAEVERLNAKYADHIEAISRPFLHVARMADPAFAAEIERQAKENIEQLRRPLQRRKLH